MKKFVLILVILLCELGLGADIYVNGDTGDNGTGDGTSGNPYKTIDYAYTTHPAISGDTIKLQAATYDDVTQNASAAWRWTVDRNNINITIEPAAATGRVTVTTSDSVIGVFITASPMIFTSNRINWVASGSYTFLLNTDIDTSTVFTDSGIENDTGQLFYAQSDTVTSPITRDCIFNDCDLMAAYSGSSGIMRFQDCDNISITGGTLTNTSTGVYAILLADSKIDSFEIKNTTVIQQASRILVSVDCETGGNYVNNINIDSCTLVNGRLYVSVDDIVGQIAIRNNTVIGVANAGTIITIGKDIGVGTNTINRPIVSGNTINNDSTSGHFLLFGTNVSGGQCLNNFYKTTDTDDFGIVIKGGVCTAIGNVIISAQGLSLFGASNSYIGNNTIVATGGNACIIDANAGGSPFPSKNTVENNIFDGRDGLLALLDDDNNAGSYSDYEIRINNNAYVLGSTGFVSWDDTVFDTNAAMVAKWATYSEIFTDNDADSIWIADPGFVDPDNGDYTPTNQALKGDDNKWIGAIQPIEKTGVYRARYR